MKIDQWLKILCLLQRFNLIINHRFNNLITLFWTSFRSEHIYRRLTKHNMVLLTGVKLIWYPATLIIGAL